MQHTNRFT